MISIGDEVFWGCTSLENITIPDSVTSIGSKAFYGCTNLKNATIGKDVISIGEEVFWGCTSLESITIPDSVTRIGSSAFVPHTQILCNKDSEAHKYATDNSLAYWLLDDDTQERNISGKVGTKLTWSIDKKPER